MATSALHNEDAIKELLDSLENVHVSPGPVFQGIKRRKALLALSHNELECIYHLTESHTPGLRFRASLQFEKNDESGRALTLNKESLEFRCPTIDVRDNITQMLKNVQEMPEEWTIVQLTPQFNQQEYLEYGPDRAHTGPIHISVFNCGKSSTEPFSVIVSAPVDKIANETVEVCKEMKDIIQTNKLLIGNVQVTREGFFRTYKDKKEYNEARETLNCRLKNVVREMQFNWLKGFRCLLIGKLVDGATEQKLTAIINQFFADNKSIQPASEKNKAILRCLIKGVMYLRLHEHKRVLQWIFPDISKDLQIKIAKFVQDVCRDLKLNEAKRHPLLLIVDEKLDLLPWEMMDVLENHPVTRMPSLHLTYALFKEHKDTIIGGSKIITNPTNGAYVLNPDSDLKLMEIRMNNFFKYWTNWTGLVAEKPTSEKFEELLTMSDIFSYHGHGNGAQFLSGDRIQKMRVKAVALLFGCSSVMLTSLGSQVEMVGQYYTYLIACSPCIVGMLWTVTDLDTDTVTTEFLSHWIKSDAPCHWKYVNKSQWQTGEPITASKSKNVDEYEPELLRALCKARKVARQYITAAACVSKGLPVKINY